MNNFIITDKLPNLRYEKQMDHFLMNTIAFSVALKTKDYSTFSQGILDEIAEDADWLRKSVEWGQTLMARTLIDGVNYKTVADVEDDLIVLLALYHEGTQEDLGDNEFNLFTNIHDKFLTLLLADKSLISYLFEGEDYVG